MNQSLIKDEDTNFVYFSEIITSRWIFWPKIQEALDQLHIEYGFLKNTKDIWARDYMPHQKHDGNFL